MRYFLYILVLSLLMKPVFADSVVLKDGEKIEGAICQVSFIVDRVKKELYCGDFEKILLKPTGEDAISLGKITQTGRLVNVIIKSPEGMKTVVRKDIRSISVAAQQRRCEAVPDQRRPHQLKCDTPQARELAREIKLEKVLERKREAKARQQEQLELRARQERDKNIKLLLDVGRLLLEPIISEWVEKNIR